MSITVPWNASWSGEERFEVRPCRYAQGHLALWQPFAPGEGRPLFAQPHSVRQRKSIAEMRCTVCGERTLEGDRWWFGLGIQWGTDWTSTESPVHRACAELALGACPHLRARGSTPERMPVPARHIAAVIGGNAVLRDFGIDTRGRVVVGHLKLVWPMAVIGETVARLNPQRVVQAA